MRWRNADFTPAFATQPLIESASDVSYAVFKRACSCLCQEHLDCIAIYLIRRGESFQCNLLQFTGGLTLDDESGQSYARVTSAPPAGLDGCVLTTTTTTTTTSAPILGLYEERYSIAQDVRFANAFRPSNVIIRKLYRPAEVDVAVATRDCAVECWNSPRCTALYIQFEAERVFCNLLTEGLGRARASAPSVSLRLRADVALEKLQSHSVSTARTTSEPSTVKETTTKGSPMRTSTSSSSSSSTR